MSPFQKRWHSLTARTLWAVIVVSTLLSFAGISFGFYLYYQAVLNEYKTNAWNLSKTAALICENFDEAEPVSRETLDIYLKAREEGLDPIDPGYNERFAKIQESADFLQMQRVLHTLQQLNNAASIYIAAVDAEENGMIYLIDSDQSEHYCPPGVVDYDLKPGEVDVYLNGADPNRFRRKLNNDDRVPADVTDDEHYGYLCTAATPLFKVDDRYTIMAFADLNMEKVVMGSREFLLQYVILMFFSMAAISLLYVYHLKRGVVGPIVKLAQAADTYAEEKRSGSNTSGHFSELNIKTGDELEELALAMDDMEKDLFAYENDLTQATAEKERMNTELTLANKIQEGMLPQVFPPFPERDEFEIYATVDPARMVGGDFYDFFLIDDDHLALVMADVSGKGIPAALFMMGSKILIKDYATIGGYGPAEVLTKVNDALCANNAMQMFVTVWLGILEISTGKLTAANAGHEYPAIRQGGGDFRLIKDKHGFILGGMEDMTYSEYELQLEPGDMVFQYTDGVTEATAADNELFGTGRMLTALNRAKDSGVTNVLGAVREAIDVFVKEAPQFDDITMLGIQYKGVSGAPGDGPGAETGADGAEDAPSDTPDNTNGAEDAPSNVPDTPANTESKENGLMKKEQMDIEAVVENLHKVISFVEGHLEEIGCPLKAKMQITVAVEEIFVNIAKYAYAPDKGNATLRIEVSGEPTTVAITFIDKGVPYDPLAKEDPDVTLPAEERQIGGLGIFMVKEVMDDVIYEYKDGSNVLTLKKEI